MNAPTPPPYVNPRIESASRADIEALQLVRVQRVVAKAYETNPFYRSLYDKAKVRPEQIRTLDDFRKRIPHIDKRLLLDDQNENPPFGLRAQTHQHTIGSVFHTSGTSGMGQEYHCLSEVDTELWSTAFFYQCAWAGIEPGDRVAHFLRIAMEAGGNWLRNASERYGLIQFHLSPYDTPQRLRTLRRARPHLMMTQPSYLTRLSILCREAGIDPHEAFPELKQILIAGEAHSGPAWAGRMEAFWGAKLGEWYGSTQAGGSHMFSCSGLHFDDSRPRMLHNIEHRIQFDVLDLEGGEPVGDGDAGEVFLTNLYNEDFPIIRFRTFDRARFRPAGYCDCGRPFHGIECGSISRVDDMIKIRGQNVWPDTIGSVIFENPASEEYQGRMWIDDRGRERVDVRVEFRGGEVSDAEALDLLETMRNGIRAVTGLSMDLFLAERGSLPRFEQTKARRWTDDRAKSRGEAASKLGTQP